MKTGLKPLYAARCITQTTHYGPSVIGSLFKEACMTGCRLPECLVTVNAALLNLCYYVTAADL